MNKIHYNGEPCDLEILKEDLNKAFGLKFVYTGEFGSPAGKWAETVDRNIMLFPKLWDSNHKRWILREFSQEDHYNGEPCALPVSEEYVGLFRFVYTGEYDFPVNKWAVSDDGKILKFSCNNWNTNKKRWILIPVPWKVGEWAFEKNLGIVEIKLINSNRCLLRKYSTNENLFFDNNSISLRSLDDSDWIRNVNGVKVRIYESQDGGFYIITNLNQNYFSKSEFPLIKNWNVPAMPPELHNNVFKSLT